MAERVFRIERLQKIQKFPANGDGTGNGHVNGQIFEEIREIKAMLANGASASETNQEQSQELFDKYRSEMAEALKLKAELDSIREAIEETKTEIASLHQSGLEGEQARVTDELGAVVAGTEQATEGILAAAEIIDENAGNLVAKLSGDDQGMASDIQDQVVGIFEACNFQDVTGQRITKVVTAMRFIEERVDRMMEIWGGIDSFSGISPVRPAAAEGDGALLNGPALVTDEGVASQDDIDALFD